MQNSHTIHNLKIIFFLNLNITIEHISSVPKIKFKVK